jgi:hypothetical protein
MLTRTYGSNSPVVAKARNIFFVLLGVGGFLLKRNYAGPYHEVFHNYGGNFAVSFAVYFMLIYRPLHSRSKRLLTVGLALGAVESFEAFDGFSII